VKDRNTHQQDVEHEAFFDEGMSEALAPLSAVGVAPMNSREVDRIAASRVHARDAVEITAYANGPYLVRGAKTLIELDGTEISLRRRAVAVCRCGQSRNLPFCDGTHKTVGFRGPGSARK
jgi:CDGSH-type Zn-finger protein